MKCDHGHCIANILRCDGNNDCGDDSDERNCMPEHGGDSMTCGGDYNKYQCTSDRTICLEMSAKCNGTAECPGGEDEIGCHGCSIDEFKCGSGECIREKFLCDTEIDCKDGSDEANCNKTLHNSRVVVNCAANLFDCKDGTCLHWPEVCDGRRDCNDGSDEGKLCDTACSRGHPCDQICRKSPSGAICECRNGFKLAKDLATCNDIDECTTIDNPCAQQCENRVGSYACSCFAGYMLERDKMSCKSTGPMPTHLYTSFTAIWHMSPHLTKVWSTNGSRIVGIDMNIRKNMLYFTVEDTDALYEYNMTDGTHLIIESIGNPTAVALDWITDNIYFVDKGDQPRIRICHANRRVCITIMRLQSMHVVKSLAVDPINRWIFYAVVYRQPMRPLESEIYRARLDGNSPTLVLRTMSHVSALACDYDRDMVYYTEWDSPAIWSVTYSGHNATKVLQNEQIRRPLSISLFEGCARVVSMASNVVVKCKLYGSKACDLYKLNVDNPGHLITVQESRQRTNVRDMCDSLNCTAICIMHDDYADCECDDGVIVDTKTPCGSSVSEYFYDFCIREYVSICFISLQFEIGAAQFRYAAGDGDSTGTFGGVFGTILLLAGLVSIVMGSIYMYRVRTSKSFNISMHFQNPKDTFDAARVKLSQFPQYVRSTRFGEFLPSRNASTSAQV